MRGERFEKTLIVFNMLKNIDQNRGAYFFFQNRPDILCAALENRKRGISLLGKPDEIAIRLNADCVHPPPGKFVQQKSASAADVKRGTAFYNMRRHKPREIFIPKIIRHFVDAFIVLE